MDRARCRRILNDAECRDRFARDARILLAEQRLQKGNGVGRPDPAEQTRTPALHEPSLVTDQRGEAGHAFHAESGDDRFGASGGEAVVLDGDDRLERFHAGDAGRFDDRFQCLPSCVVQVGDQRGRLAHRQ
jgi:hypothetical protein